MNGPVSVRVRQPAAVGATVEVASGPRVVTVGVPGPPGARGPKGDPGDRPFEYVQAVPLASWTVAHDLGRVPAAVSVYDSLGNLVETGVQVVDENTIEITMAAPMAGKVEVS